MQKENRQKYQVGVIKMLRNNSIVVKESKMEEYSTYFMLDYFDLLFYQELCGEHKIYDEYWNIRGRESKRELEYQVAYKTLSLFAEETGEADLFVTPKREEGELSDKPFLGVIQINFVHYLYEHEVHGKDALSFCEQKIGQFVRENSEKEFLEYKVYRSSTSGDFCLILKGSKIKDIFKIATFINNLEIFYKEESFKFNTYTNIGIECVRKEDGSFHTFGEKVIYQNRECEFALRFTADQEFAKKLFQKVKNKKEEKFRIEVMAGLFGRYDFMLYMTMEEFGAVYSILCASKLVGKEENILLQNFSQEDANTFLELMETGIRAGNIKIINERVLIPVADSLFEVKTVAEISVEGFQKGAKKEEQLRKAVKRIGEHLNEEMTRLQKMEGEFVEEWRGFADITRELSEVINTYVPQGIQNDSHVNWQILISDLQVIFDCIREWDKEHQKLKTKEERKDSRVQLLESLRTATDAINQHYKFLQNVNAQTWQSPLYEIQTQIDAEKMMIAYREFLYQYFFNYKELYKILGSDRPMIYPVVYPDISADRVYAQLLFPAQKSENSRLLIVKVPSFEYYGRMFDMLPWLLHEASHSIRTFSRKERNHYLTKTILRSVFSEAMYKLLDKFSNDYGYYKLGILEEQLLSIMTDAAFEKLAALHKDFNDMGMNMVEVAVRDFLKQFFTHGFFRLEREEDAKNVQAIQRELLSFLGELDLLNTEIVINDLKKSLSTVQAVKECVDKVDVLWALLKSIYDTYVEKMTGITPAEEEWMFLLKDSASMEEALKENAEVFRKEMGKSGKKEFSELIKDYCFRMRDLNRLYFAWNRKEKKEDLNVTQAFWKSCVPQIRRLLQKGFDESKGFTELYRILHMVFDNGEITDRELVRIQKEFDILLREEVENIVEREKTIYREAYADVYMAAALELDAFGYCRQMFKTVSDASIEGWERNSQSVNVHRFRTVVSVLLGKDYREDCAGNLWMSAEMLLEKGKQYCIASIECMKNSIAKKKKGSSYIEEFFANLIDNIHVIFECFGDGKLRVVDALRDSCFEIYLNPQSKIVTEDQELQKLWKEQRQKVKEIEEELLEYRHIINRIASFMVLLDLVIGNKEKAIVVRKEEHVHLKNLYENHKKNCTDPRNHNLEITRKFCKKIADYYNNPNSAIEKGHDEMLEDTIEFIQTYYYLNRFEIMTSGEVKNIICEGENGR